MKMKIKETASKFSTPLVIVGALFLAGCGGGTETAPTPAPTVNDVSLTDVTTDGAGYEAPVGTIEIPAGDSKTSNSVTFTCPAGGMDCTIKVAADGSVTSTGGAATAMNSAAYAASLEPSALQQAVDAQIASAAASKMAASLLKEATDASGNLTTKKVNGDSQLAYNNAMKVLGATSAITTERDKAAAAVKTITGLDTSESSDAEKDRIAQLLQAAEADLEAINEILDAKGSGSLMAAVDSVKGTSEETNAKIAKSKADPVATAIETAITNFTADQIGTATTGSSTGDILFVGTPGQTFKQIAGSDPLSATSLTDFKAEADGAAITTLTATATTNRQENVTYKGIPGSLVCVSLVCSAHATTYKITGSVQFVPDSSTTIYAPDGTGYKAVTSTASYGYWLNAAGTGITGHVNTLTDTAGIDWDQNEGSKTSTTAIGAIYTGKAGGYSERTVGTGAAATQASGEFAADVRLEASFGATNATIGGTISNFAAKAGSAGTGHVNENWVVGLDKKTEVNAAFTNGVVGTTTVYRAGEVGASAGIWTATPYGKGTTGENNARHPTGFVGGFQATFKDGSAAGVYQAD